MTVVVDGTSGITTNSGTVVSTTDATLNGLTVGKGGGAVATNTAVGFQAGQSNTAGTNATFIGYQAGKSATGNYNTILGSNAFGGAGGAGTDNTIIGYSAGANLTSGNGNTLLGDNAGAFLTTGTANTFIGGGIVGSTGGSGFYVTTGSKNVVLGGYNGNQGGLDIRTASNYIVLSDGDGNPRGVFDASGNYLVGTATTTNTPSQGFVLNNNTSAASIGIGHATGTSNGSTYANFCYNGTQIGTIFQATTSTVTYQGTSDYRLKENVQKLTNGLEIVLQLNPVTYTWKRGGEADEGFIAHELQEYVPHAVSGEKDQVNEDGSIKPQGIDYGRLTPYLAAAIQELKTIVDAQAAEIAELKAKVNV